MTNRGHVRNEYFNIKFFNKIYSCFHLFVVCLLYNNRFRNEQYQVDSTNYQDIANPVEKHFLKSFFFRPVT